MSSVRQGHVPDSAVILAAGMGTRLKGIGGEAPKGFLKLGHEPIIVESLRKLERAGITRVVIVTGHLHGFYDELAASWPAEAGGGEPFITTVHNERYASSGSMYSLYAARAVPAPILLLESDLIYEARALDAAMNHPAESVVLLSGRTESGDEVWADAPGGNLKTLTKDRRALSGAPAGELVGISKIGPDLFIAMLEQAEHLFRHSLKIEYEAALTAAAARVAVPCLLIPDLLWAEIDDEGHLDRARRLVYPGLV